MHQIISRIIFLIKNIYRHQFIVGLSFQQLKRFSKFIKKKVELEKNKAINKSSIIIVRMIIILYLLLKKKKYQLLLVWTIHQR